MKQGLNMWGLSEHIWSSTILISSAVDDTIPKASLPSCQVLTIWWNVGFYSDRNGGMN